MIQLRQLLAKLRWGTPLAISPQYRQTLHDEAEAKRQHKRVKPAREARQALVHEWLRVAK